MKTSLIRAVVSLVAFLSAPLAYAADRGFTALAPIPGLTDEGAVADIAGFAAFFDKLYLYLIGAAVILAIIIIIWGGLEYSTQDSISKKSDGKSKIYSALFGLMLVLSPVLVFTIINPAILNLNVNFPALKTSWGNYVPPSPPSPPPHVGVGDRTDCPGTRTLAVECVLTFSETCRGSGGQVRITGESPVEVECIAE